MPRLPGISQKEAVRVFQKRGYRVVRESGHLIMSNGERRLVMRGSRLSSFGSCFDGLLVRHLPQDHTVKPPIASTKASMNLVRSTKKT